MRGSWSSAPLLSIRRGVICLVPLLLVGAGCGDAASPERAWVSPVAAAQVVARAHGLLQIGDDAAAFALIDFDEKSHRMLGEIYDEGPRAEQERLKKHLEGQFRQTWDKHWRAPEAAGETFYTSMDWLSPTEGRVHLTMPDDPDTGRETVELTYTVSPRSEGARIVDRTLSLGGRGSTTKLFIELIKRRALPSDGGPVTLALANDAIEKLIGNIQIQRIVLGPEHARKEPAQPADADAQAPAPEEPTPEPE